MQVWATASVQKNWFCQKQVVEAEGDFFSFLQPHFIDKKNHSDYAPILQRQRIMKKINEYQNKITVKQKPKRNIHSFSSSEKNNSLFQVARKMFFVAPD